MTFVAKGYSSPELAAAPATGTSTTTQEGDAEAGAATNTVTASCTPAEPDVTIVTRVKGPEPGKYRAWSRSWQYTVNITPGDNLFFTSSIFLEKLVSDWLHCLLKEYAYVSTDHDEILQTRWGVRDAGGLLRAIVAATACGACVVFRFVHTSLLMCVKLYSKTRRDEVGKLFRGDDRRDRYRHYHMITTANFI